MTTPMLIAAFQANAVEFSALVAQLTPDVVVAPAPTANTYISRAHPGTLVSVDSGGNLVWAIVGNDSGGLTTFSANGSSSTDILGTKLVLQAGSAYAKQLDGTWKAGTRWGPQATTVVVVDPAP